MPVWEFGWLIYCSVWWWFNIFLSPFTMCKHSSLSKKMYTYYIYKCHHFVYKLFKALSPRFLTIQRGNLTTGLFGRWNKVSLKKHTVPTCRKPTIPLALIFLVTRTTLCHLRNSEREGRGHYDLGSCYPSPQQAPPALFSSTWRQDGGALSLSAGP